MFRKTADIKVYNQIRQVRGVKKLTQDQLANAAQVTRQTIISIEKGNYTPSVQLALKLAQVLEVKVEEVFSI